MTLSDDMKDKLVAHGKHLRATLKHPELVPTQHGQHLRPNGDCGTLVPGCPTCEQFAEHPITMSPRELWIVWSKFHAIPGGYENDEPRTPLDVEVVNALERAFALSRVMGWTASNTNWNDVPPYDVRLRDEFGPPQAVHHD